MDLKISQNVAILVDGNNIEISLQSLVDDPNAMIDFDSLVPALLRDRPLSRLMYFREGARISEKLAARLLENFHGSVFPCYKSADIPLTIRAIQVASKVDTIIIMSGDSDFIELVRHLKSEGVRVEIAAIETTTANVLKQECDHFHSITADYCFVYKKPRKK